MNNQTDLTADEIRILKQIVLLDCNHTTSPLTAAPEKVAAVRTKCFHRHFGGYVQSIADQLKRLDPELYPFGWTHRRKICEEKVASGDLTLLRISSIRTEASWRNCVRGLDLQGSFHLDLLPDFDCRGQNRGEAYLYLVDRALAGRLIAQSDVIKILDQPVIIELDMSNPR